MSLTNSEITELNNKVVSSYSFSTGSGTTAYDGKGSNDGTISGATWTTGKISGGLDFDGSNDYVSFSNVDNVYGITRDFSFSCWVNIDSFSTRNGIISLQFSSDSVGNNNSGLYCIVNTDGTVGLWTRISSLASEAGNLGLASTSTLSTGVDYFLTFVRSGGNLYIYKDGALFASVSTSETRNIYFNKNEADAWGNFLGRRKSSGSLESFDGTMSEIGIWNRTLTTTEITYLYNSGTGRQYPYSIKTENEMIEELNNKVVSSYSFSTGSGTTAYDGKGSNDLTITGASWITDGLDFAEGNYAGKTSTNLIVKAFGFHFKADGTSTLYQALGGFWSGSNTARKFILVSWNTASVGRIYIYDDNSSTLHTGTTNIFDGAEHFVYLTEDGTGSKVYLDGNLELTITANVLNDITSTNDFNIASYIYNSNNHPNYAGNIYNATIFNDGLNTDEITYLYNSGIGRQYPYPLVLRTGGLLFSGNKIAKRSSISTHPTLPTSLISYYNMSTGSGTTLYDQDGSIDGTISGATWTTGKISGGLDFDGSNDYVSFSNVDNVYGITRDFSFSCWVNIDSFSTRNGIISLQFASDSVGNNNSGLYCLTSTTGTVVIGVRISSLGSEAGAFGLASTSTLSTGVDYFLTFVRSGGNLYIYKDGALFASVSTSETRNIYFNKNATDASGNLIGIRRIVNPVEHFDGTMSEIGIWNRTLTTTEITDLYNSGNGLPYS